MSDPRFFVDGCAGVAVGTHGDGRDFGTRQLLEALDADRHDAPFGAGRDVLWEAKLAGGAHRVPFIFAVSASTELSHDGLLDEERQNHIISQISNNAIAKIALRCSICKCMVKAH